MGVKLRNFVYTLADAGGAGRASPCLRTRARQGKRENIAFGKDFRLQIEVK